MLVFLFFAILQTAMETGERSTYSAPIGSLKAARLILASKVQEVHIEACADTGDLYQARFLGCLPILHLKEGVLTVKPGAPFPGEESALYLHLNRAILWEIEFRGGIQNLQANLSGIQLQALDILGDARRMELHLPRPVGIAFLHISGDIRDSAIHRPAGVGMRLNVSGGMEKCSLDYQMIHFVRAETSLESRDFPPENGYYHLTVTGNVRYAIFTDTEEQAS